MAPAPPEQTGAPGDSPGALCVVIPHYAPTAPLARALASVSGWPTLLVDDSLEGATLQTGPGVERLRAAGGGGFARAANAGLAWAEARGFRWVLLLNDDAAPAPGCVEALLAAAQSPGIGAAGPALEGPGGVESAGLLDHRWSGRVRQRTRPPRGEAPIAVDALSGACLLIPARRRFDPGYPHGFEDVALCRELRAEGLRVLLVPGARCAHVGGATVPRRSRAATRDALIGHLRLVGPGRARRALVLGYALGQIARERGPIDRLWGLAEALRDPRRRA